MKGRRTGRRGSVCCRIVAGLALLGCGDASGPSVTLDGVFAYSDAGSIHLFDPAGGSDELIFTAESGTDIKNLSWAPDGQSLAFHTFEFGQHTQFIREWKIYSISAYGSETSLIFDRTGPEVYPAYGPDGRLAYWKSGRMYVDGEETDVFTGWDESAPTWSPGGRYISYAAGWELICIALNDTSDTRRPLERSKYRHTVDEPAYSPDGNQLAFVREVSNLESEIWLVDINGTNERRITQGRIDRHPSWSRDGAVIAFVRNGVSIYTIPTEPGARERLIVRHPMEHIAWTW